MVFDAHPPFAILKRLETGPITNHVNFANTDRGIFAYVSVGGLNEVQVFRTSDFARVATIPIGTLPHGVWPSGDGTRIYVGLENAGSLAAINTQTNQVIAKVAIGQAPQAIAYVSNAVPNGDGTQGLQALGVGGESAHLRLVATAGGQGSRAPTSVSLFDQGLTQVLQASVTGLQPKQSYVLALSANRGGSGALQPLAAFTTNPAGAAVVNAVGPIRQMVRDVGAAPRRYLVIAAGTPAKMGPLAQIQAP
jgi:YVTN family beta-propeller protein